MKNHLGIFLVTLAFISSALAETTIAPATTPANETPSYLKQDKPAEHSSIAAPDDLPSETKEQRDDRMAWWRDARFGMFVHWGLYSGLAGNWGGKPQGTKGCMEWMQKRVGVDTKTYADAALPKFQPVPGFALAWAKLAKQAGCQYVVFTTKHHEGFLA